jgi:hypothetical protein
MKSAPNINYGTWNKSEKIGINCTAEIFAFEVSATMVVWLIFKVCNLIHVLLN